jgi:hypothetical protein
MKVHTAHHDRRTEYNKSEGRTFQITTVIPYLENMYQLISGKDYSDVTLINATKCFVGVSFIYSYIFKLSTSRMIERQRKRWQWKKIRENMYVVMA